MSSESQATLEKITALCKRRGFVYQAADIYGGLNGVYDFGPLGALLKENIRATWKKSLINKKGKIVFLEGSLLGPHAMWEASGHVQNFSDPMIDCLNCQARFRTDDIDQAKACARCGVKKWTDSRQFNLMFQTNLGAMQDQTSTAYLRPETAQTIFVNFKNVISTTRVSIPFGIAQIGKAFRNEITPKQFLFRMREFEQMEMEWFCKPEHAHEYFDFWRAARRNFYTTIGITESRIRLREHSTDELSHYSAGTTDIEYHFPFGWKELEGIANRGDFDLSSHSKFSGKELAVHDQETNNSYIPHVVETSVGTDRLFLTVLFDAYHEDIVEGEERVVLKLSPLLAPIKAAFLPLTKKISEPMEKIYHDIEQRGYEVTFDVSGSIGKRYRRQDEIGTPLCFTYDFDSETTNTVTVRMRDTTQQERITIDQIPTYLSNILKS